MAKPVSLSQAAAVLGVHRNTLSGWLDNGCPYKSKADRNRGVEWQIDTAAVFAWRVKTAVEDAVAGFQTEAGGVSKDEADRRRAVAMAIIAEVEADTALGAVVFAADVAGVLGDFCQVLRSGIGNAGNKIAGRCAGMTSPTQIRDMCTTEFNRAFETAKAQLDDAWQRDEAARSDAFDLDPPDGEGDA